MRGGAEWCAFKTSASLSKGSSKADRPVTVPIRLRRALQQRLGDPAAQDLMTWMTQVDTNRKELRELMDVYQSRMDAKFDALEARIEPKIERRFSDLLKWSFLFWCGQIVATIGATAGLIALLRK